MRIHKVFNLTGREISKQNNIVNEFCILIVMNLSTLIIFYLQPFFYIYFGQRTKKKSFLTKKISLSSIFYYQPKINIIYIN